MIEKTFDELFLEGDNLRDNGRVEEAVAVYTKIVEKARTENAIIEAGRAMQMCAAAINSSLSSQTPSRYQDSLKYLSNAVALYQSAGDQVRVGACYRDMGIAASKMGDRSAEGYFNQAIIILEKTADYGQLAISYDKLGFWFARTGDFERALTNIDKALELFDRSSFSDFFRATTLHDKARVLAHLEKYQEAISLAIESLSWYEADHGGKEYRERICEISGLIGLCYNALGEKKAAKQYLDRYQTELKKFDPAVVLVMEAELSKIFSPRS